MRRERSQAPIIEVFLDPGVMREGQLSLQLLGTSPSQGSQSMHTYHFAMMLDGEAQMVGDIDLRLREDPLAGHIGYAVEPAFRGRQLAARSLRLLLPLARRHGFQYLWITCDPENLASRRICERLGATLVEVVDIPSGHELHALGLRHKCRYRLRT